MAGKKHKQFNQNQLFKYPNMLQPTIEQTVNSSGYILMNISFTSENQTNYLRITIMHKEHSVSLDDCEQVSRQIEKELDKKDPIPFPYILEVQSKGIGETKEHEFTVNNFGLKIKSREEKLCTK